MRVRVRFSWLRSRSARSPQAKTKAERRVAATLKALSRGHGAVVAGLWADGEVSELLVWIPFLREVVAREAVAVGDLVALVRPGADSWYSGVAAVALARDPPPGRLLDPSVVLDLLEEVRRDEAPLRSLTARLRYSRAEAEAEAEADGSQQPYQGAWSAEAARALTLGIPTTATATAKQAASIEVDLAFRAAQSLGTPFALVASDATVEADAFLDNTG